MADAVRRNAEQGVVFGVWRRDHDRIRSQAAENRILEGFEPRMHARQQGVANIHTHDAVGVFFRGNADEKVAIAATEVQNRTRPSIPDNVTDSIQA